jgi:hypothetical protein
MRPVLMTSAALIFGLLPLALSNATGAEFRAPMAIIVIGGLVTSTALTLVVVPVFYSLVDGATERARRGAGRLREAVAGSTRSLTRATRVSIGSPRPSTKRRTECPTRTGTGVASGTFRIASSAADSWSTTTGSAPARAPSWARRSTMLPA